MKKKFVLGLLAASLLSTSILAACGGNGGDKKSSSVPEQQSSSSAVPSSNADSLSSQGVTTSSSNLPSSSSLPTPSSNSSQPAASSSSAKPSSSSSAPAQSSSSQPAASSSSAKPSSSSSQQAEFSFEVALSTGSETMNKGQEAHVVINASGGDPSVTRNYTYKSNKPTILSVTNTGTVTALSEGEARIQVTETVSKTSKFIFVTITDASPANGGYNFASSSGPEAIAQRTEILGSLEKYAMDNHLTGLTLFENGGYVKYSERVHLPTTEYITGYGFGLLSEGTLSSPMPAANEGNPNHRMYLHTGTSQDPATINARNNTGSQVSDLEGYITSSFWGTKMNSTKNGYEWYPVLAKDTVTYDGRTTAFNRPIPVYQDQEVKPGEEPNTLGLYSTWRIYVKTGSVLKYRYQGNSWGKEFDGREVSIDDYEFAYRLLLTGCHNLVRGSEMAGDQTYGIVGAQRYNLNTKGDNVDDAGALKTWNDMKAAGELGIKTGHDNTNGDFIQLTLLNPIDRFTAMYTLSSSLLSPLPEEFLSTIGNGSVKKGAKLYGQFNDNTTVPAAHQNHITDFVLSLGAYMLEDWQFEQAITFKKNDLWDAVEPGRYLIEGVKILIIDSSNSTTKIYERFNNGDVDSVGIPTKFIDREVGQPRVYKTRGDATFKLNVNSCTQEEWNRQFGPEGKINKGSNWNVKAWMSNDNFLNGLFQSINRKEFANKRGVQPSINYFSDAYLSDPENGVSYNDTQAHKDAVSAYQVYDSNGESTYGYSYDRAVSSFRAAVRELVADPNSGIDYGTKSNPTEMKIHIRWMYQTDEEEYGNAIAKYFTDAFNDSRVCDNKIKLVVEQAAVDNWQDVYNVWMMQGQFDLAFGAISGNTYNPLNFLEVLKSDNSSGFTLNWGTNTSKVTAAKPLIYNNKIWSFDALWTVADHGGVVTDGEIAKTVEMCYLITPQVNEVYNGYNFSVATQFIDSDSVQVALTRIQIYVFGSGGYTIAFTPQTSGNLINAVINLSTAKAQEIEAEMRRVNHMDDMDKYPSLYNEHPFTLENYGATWAIEISYSFAIKVEGSSSFGTPTESYAVAAKNRDAVIEDQEVVTMKRQALLLATLLATTALVGCGGNGGKKSSSIIEQSSSSVEPSSSSELPSSSSLEPSSSSEAPSSSSLEPSSSSVAPSSSSVEPSSSSELPSSSSELPSSSSLEPSSSSEAPSSSSSNPGPTPMIPIDPDFGKDFDYTSKAYPDEILTDKSVVGIIGEETYQLEVLKQLNYSGENVTFSSNDPTIATVSDKGLITGVGAGETVVVVADKDNPQLRKEVRVVVSPTITEADAKALNTNGFEAAAEAENIQAIVDNEMYMKTVYKNGNLHTYDRWDQRMTASREDAYFRIWETDAEIKADDAAMDFTSYEWIFNTNVFYDTYMYHTSGDKKTYLPVATQSYMSDDNRVKPLIDILDNLFTSGSGIFNNTFDNASLADMSDRIGASGSNVSNVYYGSYDAQNLVFSYKATFEDTADLDDENRYGIPCGTALHQTQILRYVCVNNRIVAFDIDITQDYTNEITGDEYHEVWQMYHTFEDVDEQKSQIYIPNKKDYTRVDDIFDL